MKYISYFNLLILIVVFSCKKEKEITPGKGTNLLTIVKKIDLSISRNTFKLGEDSQSITIKISAFDANGKSVVLPDSMVKFYANNQLLLKAEVLPTEEKNYEVYAQFGDIKTNIATLKSYIRFRTIDINVSKNTFFLEEDKTAIQLSVVGVDSVGGITPLPMAHIFLNDQILATSSFIPDRLGDYTLKAKFLRLESQPVIVRSISIIDRIKKLKLTASRTYHTFDEDTEPINFTVTGTDSTNKEYILSLPTIQLLSNNTPLMSANILPKTSGNFTIKAKLGTIESNSILVLSRAFMDRIKSLRVIPSKFTFMLDEDITPITLEVRGEDSTRKSYNLAPPRVTLFVNNQALNGNTFIPNQKGTFIVKAEGNKIVSPTQNVTAKILTEEAGKIIVFPTSDELGIISSTGRILADGKTTLKLTNLFYDKQDNFLNYPKGIKYYANGQVLTENEFKTSQAGTYRLQARGYGVSSNELVLVARPLTTYPVVKIPIIFHALNVSLTKSDVEKEITLINNYFRKQNQNSVEDPNYVDTFIEFYLATKDPNGQLLTEPGINRIDGPKKTEKYSTKEMDEQAWLNYWQPKSYLNVWVANIDFLGSYARFPAVAQPLAGTQTLTNRNATPAAPYGTFYRRDMLGKTTLAHEVGHMLACEHVFNEVKCDEADYCFDTPEHYLPDALKNYLNLTTVNRSSCNSWEGGGSFKSTNIMDYGEGYKNSFTWDQRERMRHVIEHGLWLPTPNNGFKGGRLGVSEAGKVTKPKTVPFGMKIVFCPEHQKFE